MHKLKEELEFRYRLTQFLKRHREFLCNRMEIHNVNIIYKALEDINITRNKNSDF